MDRDVKKNSCTMQSGPPQIIVLRDYKMHIIRKMRNINECIRDIIKENNVDSLNLVSKKR